MTLLPDNTDPMLDGFNLPSDPAPETHAEFSFEFPEQPAPEPDAPAEPEPAAPPVQAQPDVQAEILETLRSMRQPQPPQAQPGQPEAWVDPASRPENAQRVSDLMERLSWDEDARREYNQLQVEWNTERTQRMIQEQFGQFQQQQALVQLAPTLQTQAYQHVAAQYGQALTQDAFNAVVQDAFGGNAAQVAQALNPQLNPAAPQLAALLADAAYGRQLRTNPAQPQRPAPPATVRSDARNPQPGRGADQWNDPNWVNSVIDQVTQDPFRFTRRNNP